MRSVVALVTYEKVLFAFLSETEIGDFLSMFEAFVYSEHF
jgi:hypothetical protein